jgi:hypothetical protein
MVFPLRTERSEPPESVSRIRLVLRTSDGGQWAVSLSVGMERFIGHYPRMPGLGSGGALLEYQPVGCARNG